MQKISAGKFHRALPRTMGYENGLLRFDAGLLDDRPPFLDLGLLIGTKCLRRLPLALRNFKALLDEALTYSRTAQRAHGAGIELADDVLRRAPGRKKASQKRKVKHWQSRLVHGRDIWCYRQTFFGRDGKGFCAAGAHMRQ